MYQLMKDNIFQFVGGHFIYIESFLKLDRLISVCVDLGSSSN